MTNLILPGFASTSLMTIYSYMAGSMLKRNFSEPQLLARIISACLPVKYRKYARLAGWISHFGLGLCWYLVLVIMRRQYLADHRSFPKIRFGTYSGFLAIVSWRYLFLSSGNLRMAECISFYGQLFVAHLVFSAASDHLAQRYDNYEYNRPANQLSENNVVRNL